MNSRGLELDIVDFCNIIKEHEFTCRPALIDNVDLIVMYWHRQFCWLKPARMHFKITLEMMF